jgi:hypothetical protein
MAGREQDSRERREAGVVLRLLLEPGDPLTGSVSVEGQPEEQFCGWIELMAAVNDVRQRAAGGLQSH